MLNCFVLVPTAYRFPENLEQSKQDAILSMHWRARQATEDYELGLQLHNQYVQLRYRLQPIVRRHVPDSSNTRLHQGFPPSLGGLYLCEYGVIRLSSQDQL